MNTAREYLHMALDLSDVDFHQEIIIRIMGMLRENDLKEKTLKESSMRLK